MEIRRTSRVVIPVGGIPDAGGSPVTISQLFQELFISLYVAG